ncbi:unnamed protein product [Cylicocyclus nassatus]|uniref:Uncharacterized protein n=1 Tax=Cylicocyclus nassatus TaxID=53992 RepID=A0AA36GSZ1_CYLNA|nr:unnamed protein product [Cylicocyclus nassatus]
MIESMDTGKPEKQIKEKVQQLKAEVPGEGKGPNEENKSTNQDLPNKRIGTLYEPRLNPHFQNWEENGREPEMAARSCPEKHNSRQNRAITQNEESMAPFTSLIHRVKAIGVITQCEIAKMRCGSANRHKVDDQHNTIQVLAAAYERGYDADSLERIQENGMNIVYDASSNEIKFLGGVRIPTAIQGGRTAQVAFYISEEDSLEILLGTNALESLGISIALQPERQKQGGHPQEQETVVRVGKRVIVPSYGIKLATANCVTESEEGVLWSKIKGVTSGVYKITNETITIPVLNSEEAPLILRKGDELGELTKERWIEKWEKFTMPDHGTVEMEKNEKKKLLWEQIKPNQEENEFEKELQDILEEYIDDDAPNDDVESRGDVVVDLDEDDRQ